MEATVQIHLQALNLASPSVDFFFTVTIAIQTSVGKNSSRDGLLEEDHDSLPRLFLSVFGAAANSSSSEPCHPRRRSLHHYPPL